jgi:predicted acyl esterase
MTPPSRRIAFRAIVGASLLTSAALAPLAAQVTTLPSETPTRVQPTNYGFDYARRDVMIPMRDGVKLHTVILVPAGAHNAPMLLTRTPYDATATTTNSQSSHLASTL